jgi:hypothetical protein
MLDYELFLDPPIDIDDDEDDAAFELVDLFI